MRFLLACCCCLFATAIWAQTVHREVLPNGLTVISVDRRNTHAAEVLVLVEAGPADEGRLSGTGVSRVLQGLVVAGAQARAGDIARVGDHLATITPDFTDEDFTGITGYALTTTDRYVPEALGLLAEVIGSPPLTDAALQRELALIDAASAEIPADRRELRELTSVAFRTHPVRLPAIGVPQQRRQLDTAQVAAYHAQTYTATRTTVVVVGNIDQTKVVDLVGTAFANLPTGDWMPPPTVTEPVQFTQRTRVVPLAVSSERHAYGWRTQPLTFYRDQAVLEVITGLLAKRLQQRFTEMREVGPVASDVRVENRAAPTLPGLFLISYRPDSQAASDAWLAVQRELEALRSEGPGEGELAAVKRGWLREHTSELAAVAGIARDLARWELAVGDPAFGRTFRNEVENVSIEEVKRVVGTLLHPKGPNLSKVILVPLEDSHGGGNDGERTTLTDVAPRVVDLPLGARLVHRFMPTGLAHVRVAMTAGSGVEPAEIAGATALLADVLAEGSANRQGDDLRRVLTDYGIALEFEADAHHLDIHLTCFPEQVDKALEILVDLIKQPALPEAAVERAIQDQMARLGDTRGGWSRRLLAEVRSRMLDGHYGALPLDGFRQSLAAMNRQTLLDWYRTITVGGNLVFAIYGEYDQATVADQLADLLTRDPVLTAGDGPVIAGADWNEAPPPALTTLTADKSESSIALAWRAPGLEARGSDGPAMDLLSALLVGNRGRGGRLGRALAAAGIDPDESVLVDRETYVGRGLLVLRIKVPGERLAEVRELVHRTTDELVAALRAGPDAGTQNLTESEIRGAMALCVNARILANEDQARVSAAHARNLLLKENLEHTLAYRARIAVVSWDELTRVATTYLDRDPVVVQLAPPQRETPPPEVVEQPAPATNGTNDLPNADGDS